MKPRTSIIGYSRLILLSTLMGLLIGLSVTAFLNLYGSLRGLTASIVRTNALTTIVLPALGFTVAYLIVREGAKTKTTGCGTHQLLEVYHYEGGLISVRDALCKTLASAVTIGFGGSAGLEGPSLLLGGGIASAIGRRLNLRREELRIYLLCGAAAGLSAVFKAPLTGMLFALEIPYQRDLVKEAFIPATFSSLAAYFVLVSTMGIETLFPPIQSIPIVPSISTILHALLLGLLSAVCGLAFIKVFEALGELRSSLKVKALVHPMLGGLMVGLTGFYIPQVLGVGYDTIHAMAIGEIGALSLTSLLALAFFKVLATSITLNSGGSGGLFIPSIYVGAVLGALYSKILLQTPSEAIVLAAMAAVMAATHKTLLSSVAFVAEVTGPSSIIPALVAATTGYFASGSFSFYQRAQPLEKPVEEEEAIGILYHSIEKNRGLEGLEKIRVGEVMTKNPVALRESMSVQESIDTIKRHDYRVYPIVNHGKVLVGYVTVEDLLTVPEEKRLLPVSHVPTRRPLSVTEGDTLSEVMKAMLRSKVDHAYVVSDLQTMRLVGVVAGIDIVRRLL